MGKLSIFELTQQLASVEDADLAEVFGELFKVKHPYTEEPHITGQYFLGIATHSPDEEPSWEVRAAAYADKSIYGDTTGVSFPHFGMCFNCRTQVLGAVKKVICPVCKEKIQLT